MRNADGIPRRAILVMTAILISVILGSQASSRATHQLFEPSNPLALFTKGVAVANGKVRSSSALALSGQSGSQSSAKKAAQVFAQDNDTIIHKSGSIVRDETWSNTKKTYYIDSTIQITKGVTLTLAPGVSVKVSKDQTAFKVADGAALAAQGTKSQPITITSAFDGGDTIGSLGPAAGDYKTAIEVDTGATLSLSNARIAYADAAINSSGTITMDDVRIANANTGIDTSGGSAVLNDMLITQTARGIDAGAGLVTFRGSIIHATDKAIRACIWGSDSCMVDAAYTDWGTVDGPNNNVCGQVQTVPWKFGDAVSSNSQPLLAPNCDGSASPDQQVAGSIDAFRQRRAAREATCSGEAESSCNTDSDAFSCLSTSLDGAIAASPFAFPGVDALGNGSDTFYTALMLAAQEYVTAQAQQRPTVATMQNLAYIGYAKNVFGAVNAAYNSCAP